MRKRQLLIVIFVGIVILLVATLVYVRVWRGRNIERQNAEYETRAGIDEYQLRLEEKHPFVKLLPYYAGDFEVHYGVSNFETMDVVYSLVIKINAPSNEEGGDENLYFAIKDKAFAWIRSHGEDPLKMPLEIQSVTPSTSY